MNTIDLIIILFCIVAGAALSVISYISEKVKNRKWRFLYLIPFFACLIGVLLAGFDKALLPICIGAILTLEGFITNSRKQRLMDSVILIALSLVSLILTLTMPSYRVPEYVQNFNNTVDVLEDKYVLTKHKDIDFESLRAEFTPRFAEAEKNKDEAMNAALWIEFASRFHDGHVGYGASDDILESALDNICGNDFGFATIKLSDGRFVAVNTDSNYVPFGNGTEILSIDGITPEEIVRDRILPLAQPVLENELFYKSLMAGGSFSDEISVVYMDENSNEQSISLSKIGHYYERFMDTLDIVDDGVNIGTTTFTETDDHTCLYRIKQMSTDTKSYGKSNYPVLHEDFRNALEEYKARGFDKLIIDLRKNSGGDPFFDIALVSLLAPEGEHYICSSGVLDETTNRFIKDENGDYIVGESLTYTGENVWGDREIVILTNGECVSAGDDFIHMMKEFPNVTVVGFTCSNSSCQAVSSIAISDNESFSFSAVPHLNRDGSTYIDTSQDRQSGVGIDIIVPMTEEAVKAIFDEGRDYVLEYVSGI